MNKSSSVQRRMWFGVDAAVTIGPGFIHKAGFGKILIPHPPVINWLLRLYLTEDDRYSLSITHEFGHLQTVPLAVLYTGGMLVLASIRGHTGLIEIILVLISTHAAWEIAAEIVTITGNVPLYRKYYEEITIVPRVMFWVLTGALSLTGWVITFS
jgi:hypothetical protein